MVIKNGLASFQCLSSAELPLWQLSAMTPFLAASTGPAALRGSSQYSRIEAQGAKCCASSQERGILSYWELYFSGWVFMQGELCINSQAQAELAPVPSGVSTGLSDITQCFIGWRIEVLLGGATCPLQMRNFWGELWYRTPKTSALGEINLHCRQFWALSVLIISVHCPKWHLSCQLFASSDV